ncbi:LysR substrate-binding domain-containing protein [Streptomyces sp. NPDC059875]|uniref:LysR substrate-binding domain-containing protein n=1 Tax=unclassified Streptomyces TaxID=2593676 RepID=UPI003657A00F
MELRDIEIFLVLTEELHVGRTAQRYARQPSTMCSGSSAAVPWTSSPGCPVEEPDFTVGPTLCTDSRILAVAADHRLAGRGSVPLELLADFPHATALGLPDYWEDSYLPFSTPPGRTIERITSAASDNPDELISHVGMGDIIQTFPGHVTGHWSMSNIRFLPVPEMATLTFALVWRTEAENDLIPALANTVGDLGVFRF